jgi:hypothetical protein
MERVRHDLAASDAAWNGNTQAPVRMRSPTGERAADVRSSGAPTSEVIPSSKLCRASVIEGNPAALATRSARPNLDPKETLANVGAIALLRLPAGSNRWKLGFETAQ